MSLSEIVPEKVSCRHWIGSDSAGHVCGSDADGPLPYCPKHLEVQKRRVAKDLEKSRAQSARAEAAWLARNLPRLPQMRVQLERAEAEFARRTASAGPADLAAHGGAMHQGIRREKLAKLSDTNVTRVLELEKLIERLRKDIARADRAVSS
jgi:hypothetical protein